MGDALSSALCAGGEAVTEYDNLVDWKRMAGELTTELAARNKRVSFLERETRRLESERDGALKDVANLNAAYMFLQKRYDAVMARS
jgi:hypothetical protein